MFSFETTVAAPAWFSDNTSDNYVAGRNAQERGKIKIKFYIRCEWAFIARPRIFINSADTKF